MKTEMIHSLTNNFEAHAQRADNGVEFWLARDIQYLLGYTQWRNFLAVINKAKTACEVSEHPITDHFADVSKMVDLGSGSQRDRLKCQFGTSSLVGSRMNNSGGRRSQIVTASIAANGNSSQDVMSCWRVNP